MHLTRPHALLGAALLVLACGGDRGPTPLTIVPLPSPAADGAAEPFVAADEDGAAVLSWLERQADSTVALKVARLGPEGAWSAPREVVRRDDLFVNWADFPSVTPIGGGKLLAHWLQRSGTGRFAYDVRLAESADGGATWGTSALPHRAGVPAEHGFVTVLPLGNGEAGVVLLDGTAGALAAEEVRRRTGKAPAEGHGGAMQLGFASWRGGTVADAQVIDPRTCDCCQTTAVMTSRGPVVVYRDRSDDEIRDMSVLRLVDGAWSAPAPLHADGWRIDYCPVNGPAASAVHDTIVAAWYTAAQDTARVRVAFSADAGASFSAPVRVDDGNPTGRVDVELLDGDRALVSWIERTGGDTAQVRARIVRRDGSLEPSVVVSPSSGTRASGFPRMARVGRDVVLAWTMPGTPSTVRVARVRVGAP